ncbi:MAG: hypothetical protein M0Q94_08915 [Candidatus Cloacimonetes bacterium]|jgi:hypothetical protein|nr:hypothetical protein [Candidatus Cloacimonadota bacterium]
MGNKALVLLFNKIYNNGKLTSIVASKKDIKNLETFYKNNFQKTDTYSEFIREIGKLGRILNLSKAASAEFEKQFNKRQGLQPSILNECFVIQTIADLLKLDHFIDADEKVENVPVHLLRSLIKARGGELESQYPRYIYHGDKQGVVLLQYGDSASIDAIFVNEGSRIRLEIKDSKAKMGEFDLSYGEDGKLIPSDKIIEEFPAFLKFINKFNSETTVFDQVGRNYKFGKDIDQATAVELVDSTFKTKKIDLYLLQNSSKLFTLPTEYLLDNIDISGSEIRTAGRNHFAVFTPANLLSILNSLNAQINGNQVKLLYDAAREKKGRGMTVITRYDINSLYFLKINNVNINTGFVFFDLKDVEQKKPTISMHVYTILNEKNLAEISKILNP